jgi:general nucleoside transport system permease protein
MALTRDDTSIDRAGERPRLEQRFDAVRNAGWRPLLSWSLIVAIVVALVWAYQWDGNQTTAVAARTVREAAPLLLGALCGLIGERSGIINIGIEGQMLLSAFAGFMAASYTFEWWNQAGVSIWLGVAAAVGIAGLAGLFLAWASVTLKMDQIIAGTVINIFAAGATSFYYVQGRTMPTISNIAVPGLSELPLLGRMLFNHGPLTYAALILVVVVHIALFKGRWGLRTRSVGEHPSAADTVGIRVLRLRYVNVVVAASFAGLAGMHLIQSASAFNRGMSNGRGFIALAVMLFGRYRPFGALGAALLFGFFNALQAQLQFRGTFDIPPQFFGMIPYLLTVVVLAVAGLKARPPAAVGKPYEKE